MKKKIVYNDISSAVSEKKIKGDLTVNDTRSQKMTEMLNTISFPAQNLSLLFHAKEKLKKTSKKVRSS